MSLSVEINQMPTSSVGISAQELFHPSCTNLPVNSPSPSVSWLSQDGN